MGADLDWFCWTLIALMGAGLDWFYWTLIYADGRWFGLILLDADLR